MQGITLKSTDFLQPVIAPAGGQGNVTLSYVCPHCNCFPREDYIWWVATRHGDSCDKKKKSSSWWCAVCGGPYEWRAPNRILVVQTDADASQAKVFKAHAAPQGLCENLIDALKFLAKQQSDGDSPIQSIVTGLHERSRKRIMDGLRSFIEVDNHFAVELGEVREGTRPFKVRKPNFWEEYPEATIREGPEESVLRAEEVSCINIDHIEADRWGPPLVDADWHAFCQAIYEGIERSEWEELYEHYKEMSKAAGAKKPSENQRAKSYLENEGNKGER